MGAVAEPAIRVRGLRKTYDGVERVRAIDFEVATGEVFGLLGTNGAGKTTTIEILEGFRTRDSGTVSVLGVDPDHPTRAWREQVGIVLQESELDPLYTVGETVTQFARYFADPAAPSDVLARVGLAGKGDERVGRLSGGQKRAVDVALGLVGSPSLLFLDEPTTGLDPAARREMWTMVDRLREGGTTVMLTTHYMDEAQHLADHLVIMRSGEVVGSGTPAELVAHQGTGAVVSFRIDGSSDSPTPEAPVLPRLSVTVELVDGSYRFRTAAPQQDLYTLLRWADETGVVLAQLEVDRPSLDDVFLQLTGDDAGEAGAVGP